MVAAVAILCTAISGCAPANPSPADSAKTATPAAIIYQQCELSVALRGVPIDQASAIIILMHGFGAPANDLVPMADSMWLASDVCFVFPAAPIELQLRRGRRAWWTGPDGFDPACEQVMSLLACVHSLNPRAQIVLGGFSQGAILTSNLLAQNPQLLTAAILLAPSGDIRRELDPDAADKPRVFLAHGRTDAQLPFEGSEAFRQKLEESNYEVEWVPFDGGHTISAAVVLRLNDYLNEILPAADSRPSDAG